jgi:hypothetical protein
MELMPDVGSDTATLAWLVSALDHAREHGNAKLVGYLETLADDVVFEAEMAARRASMLARLG